MASTSASSVAPSETASLCAMPSPSALAVVEEVYDFFIDALWLFEQRSPVNLASDASEPAAGLLHNLALISALEGDMEDIATKLRNQALSKEVSELHTELCDMMILMRKIPGYTLPTHLAAALTQLSIQDKPLRQSLMQGLLFRISYSAVVILFPAPPNLSYFSCFWDGYDDKSRHRVDLGFEFQSHAT